VIIKFAAVNCEVDFGMNVASAVTGEVSMDLECSSYEAWLAEFRHLAEDDDLGWLVSSAKSAHLDAYRAGVSPTEELQVLADMAEWRGCGCGGG
jgi:hypothetical protein